MKIEELSLQSITNLTTSSLFPKLFELLVDGNELLVKHSLSIHMSSFEFDKTHNLLSHILNCKFIDAIALRVDQLKCKSLVANSSDLKANRCQTLTKNKMSSMAKALFRHFSRALALMSITISDLDVELKSQILSKMSPLLLRFLICWDSKVIRNAVDILKWLTKNGNPTISFVIVESFGQILFQLTDKREETIISSLLQLFEALISCCPQLSVHKSFASSLVICLEKILLQNDPKLDTEVTDFIENISKLIVVNNDTVRHLSHRLLCLSSFILQTKGSVSQLLAVSAIETLICKYSFKSFIDLCKVFDIKQVISVLIISVNFHFQQTGLTIVGHILNIMRESYDSMPEEVESVKHSLFNRSSHIYNCLNELSFNTTLSVSSAANFLLNRIEESFGSGEDQTLVPQINGNGFVFAVNF